MNLPEEDKLKLGKEVSQHAPEATEPTHVVNLGQVEGMIPEVNEETDPTVPGHVKSITPVEKGNWNTAYFKRITGLSVTGTTTKTITITLADGTTVTGSFVDDGGGVPGESDGNDYVSGGNFNTATGQATLTRTDGGTVVFTFDGRYALIGHNHAAADITSGTLAIARIPQLAPSKVSQDASNRFVSDSEKTAWNGKAPGTHTHTFPSLTAKPTTIEGYGIVDAFTQALADARYLQSFNETDPKGVKSISITGTTTKTITITRNDDTTATATFNSSDGGATYALMTLAALTTGTDNTARTISAKILNDWITTKNFLTSVSWVNVGGKPAAFPPESHTHAASDVTSGAFADARIPQLAPTKITQNSTNRFVTDAEKTTWNGKAAGTHVHAAGDITSGTLADARIPSLNASKTTAGTFNIARIPTGFESSQVLKGSELKIRFEGFVDVGGSIPGYIPLPPLPPIGLPRKVLGVRYYITGTSDGSINFDGNIAYEEFELINVSDAAITINPINNTTLRSVIGKSPTVLPYGRVKVLLTTNTGDGGRWSIVGDLLSSSGSVAKITSDQEITLTHQIGDVTYICQGAHVAFIIPVGMRKSFRFSVINVTAGRSVTINKAIGSPIEFINPDKFLVAAGTKLEIIKTNVNEEYLLI